MVIMTFHDDHRIQGQLTGLTKSIRDEPNKADEVTPKTSPKSIHITDENSITIQCTNNASDGYKTNCTDR